MTTISKILRVDDPGYPASQKLKHFTFELTDGTKIAGLPITETFLTTMPFLENCGKNCEVLWMNVQEVTLVTWETPELD